MITMNGAVVVLKASRIQRRNAPGQIAEDYERPRRALVLYVMLNRRCSEEAAHQRIATLVKKRVPLDDHGLIDWMLAQDRQGLVNRARDLLMRDPDEIDDI